MVTRLYNFNHYTTYPISEGVHDPAIFKAVFTAGGPGSGKSFIMEQLGLINMGYRRIDIDNAFTMIAKKKDFNLRMSEKEAEQIERIRVRAKELTSKQLDLTLDGRLGLIIDGTGKDANKIKNTRSRLENFGYETMMIFVNTSLETALERNKRRSRRVPEDFLRDSWEKVQKNLGKFQSMFGTNRLIIIDNDENIGPDINNAYRSVLKFTRQKPRSKEARQWIEANS